MKVRGLKIKPAPGLGTVQGVPVGLNAASPLTLPTKALTNLGPAEPNVAQTVAQTAKMAANAAAEPAVPKAPKGGIRKIRIRRKRMRYVPAAPSGGFTLPTTPQY